LGNANQNHNGYFIPITMSIIKKRQINEDLVRIWENQNPDSLWWECKTVQPTLENSLASVVI
jgi:hypothetical protein